MQDCGHSSVDIHERKVVKISVSRPLILQGLVVRYMYISTVLYNPYQYAGADKTLFGRCALSTNYQRERIKGTEEAFKFEQYIHMYRNLQQS